MNALRFYRSVIARRLRRMTRKQWIVAAAVAFVVLAMITQRPPATAAGPAPAPTRSAPATQAAPDPEPAAYVQGSTGKEVKVKFDNPTLTRRAITVRLTFHDRAGEVTSWTYRTEEADAKDWVETWYPIPAGTHMTTVAVTGVGVTPQD